jgi:peptidoglycan/LPS O-acetylase OafA/YrhL
MSSLGLSTLLAYVTAVAVAMTVAYVIGRLRGPRWAYWAFAIACFAGSVSMVVLFSSWNADSPWPNAISIGLAAVAGSTIGPGFHGRTQRAG